MFRPRLVPAGLLSLGLLAFAVFALPPAAHHASAEEGRLQVTSHILYDIRPDQGPVHVSWDVTLQNNDPQTARGAGRSTGAAPAYEEFSFPVLRGAGEVTARSSSGSRLDVVSNESEQSPVIGVTVKLDKPLFYQDTYALKAEYDIPQTRQKSLLVTPVYVFLPIVATGDQATVDISAPSQAPWATSLEPQACTQNATPSAGQSATFTCSGSDSVYLAALAEVSRPDLTAEVSSQVALKDKTLNVSITYFQGDDGFARHLQELVSAALPKIEDSYGFHYSGPSTINITERGRQVILGYEGLTECDPGGSCEIAVSPMADDYTVLHELAHLWSGIYGKRWLSEGFAQFSAEKAAAGLPAGLVQGPPPSREQPSSVNLQLDGWGDVTSVIGASEDELDRENAGYYRSERFIATLESEFDLPTLQKVNQAIAQSGTAADSRRYMDILEETSGRNPDALFSEWVFPRSFDSTLSQRRQARDRLQALTARAESEGLSQDIPNQIRQNIEAWRFAEALAALDQAAAGLQAHDTLKGDLSQLRKKASAAGLILPDTFDAAIARWDFDGAGRTVNAAFQALDAYSLARARVEAPRSLWRRFGLLGSDPQAFLEKAADAFSSGDFQSAIDQADKAADAIDNASQTAVRRMLIVAVVLAVFALGILAAVWVARLRERELA